MVTREQPVAEILAELMAQAEAVLETREKAGLHSMSGARRKSPRASFLARVRDVMAGGGKRPG